VFNPVLKSMKSGEHIFDMNIRFLNQAAHDRRRRRFQPNRIDIFDCQTVTTSG
jgi:hypothetical protein